MRVQVILYEPRCRCRHHCCYSCCALSQVKFLEAGLKQAKQDESGRNALIKQVTTLEEENKHSRQRLDTRQAEAQVSVFSRTVAVKMLKRYAVDGSGMTGWELQAK